MEQKRHYEMAQNFIDALTGISSDERHRAQADFQRQWTGENRAERRARERQERRNMKKAKS